MREGIKLIKPTVRLEKEYNEFYAEWKSSGEDMVPWVIKKDPREFNELVQFLLDGESHSAGRVPHSTYWLVTDSDRILGVVNIRHSLTDQLLRNGGHIGYGIRPSERRKGHARNLLRLTLQKVHSMGMEDVLIVCDAWNEASKRTIMGENCRRAEDFVEGDGNVILRYWVKTNETAKNGMGRQFMGFIPLSETDMGNYGPIAGSFSIVFKNEKVLLCYHSLRQQWELPAGKREGQETAHACAIRELYEETGQKLNFLHFKGLMKIKKPSGEIQYNPVFSTYITELQPFVENDETSRIILWDGKEEIGMVDRIDEELIQIFLKGTR